MSHQDPRGEPKYTIGIAARLVELHPQTLRHYEGLGLVTPRRTGGNRRLYSERDLERLRLICRLTGELGVNLAGVEVILNMTEQIRTLQEEANRREQQLLREIEYLRRLVAAEGRARVLSGKLALPPAELGE
ncbi:MAG: heat shock protein transcriptional repressor HspR [Anaerolineae bacterium]